MKKILLLLALMSGVSHTAVADYRYYAWTYQFMTMLPGRVEAEIYNRFKQPDASDSSTGSWKRQYEIETGITPGWDVSLYHVESYSSNDTTVKADEIKLRTRFKLARKDAFIVDPAIYVEYKVQSDRTFPDTWETKLILAKDMGKLNIAINLTPEESYYSGTREKYWKTEYAAGASYPLYGAIARMGIELTGDITNSEHSVGPVLSFKGQSLWSSIGPQFGLNGNSDTVKIQWIVGILI